MKRETRSCGLFWTLGTEQPRVQRGGRLRARAREGARARGGCESERDREGGGGVDCIDSMDYMCRPVDASAFLGAPCFSFRFHSSLPLSPPSPSPLCAQSCARSLPPFRPPLSSRLAVSSLCPSPLPLDSTRCPRSIQPGQTAPLVIDLLPPA